MLIRFSMILRELKVKDSLLFSMAMQGNKQPNGAELVSKEEEGRTKKYQDNDAATAVVAADDNDD